MQNEAHNLLLEILKRIKEDNPVSFDFGEPDDLYPLIDIDGAGDLFAEECIFDQCSDSEATQLLRSWINHEMNDVCWEVNCELAKLLANRGKLVQDLIDPIVHAKTWTSEYHLRLAGLAICPNGQSEAIRYLDIAPEDSRDGLFLACWKLNSREVDQKLMECFIQWDESGEWSPGGTGELQALGRFLKRWMNIYPASKLEPLIRIFFQKY